MAQEQISYFAKRLLGYKTLPEGVNRGDIHAAVGAGAWAGREEHP